MDNFFGPRKEQALRVEAGGSFYMYVEKAGGSEACTPAKKAAKKEEQNGTDRGEDRERGRRTAR